NRRAIGEELRDAGIWRAIANPVPSLRPDVTQRDHRVPGHLLFDGKVVLIYRRRPRLRLPHAVRDLASAHALQTRTREARIVDLCGLQESGSCVLIVKAAHNLVVVNADAAADHRPALAEGHPGEAKARREIMK